jgi:adenosine deaminase
LHCGEVKTPGEEAAMLHFRPERLGHCVKTVRDEELWRQLRKTGTPVELCITSNVITDSIHGGNGGGGSRGRNDNDGSCSNGGGGGMGKGAKGINTAAAAARHHLGIMFSAGHPICICTDDPGVFSTTLSREYALAAASMELRDDDLRRLAVQAMDFAFLGVSAVSAAASHRTLGTAADASHWPPDVSSVPYSQPASMASDAERHQNDAANKALAVAVRRQLEIGVAAWSGLPKTMT